MLVLQRDAADGPIARAFEEHVQTVRGFVRRPVGGVFTKLIQLVPIHWEGKVAKAIPRFNVELDGTSA